MDVFSVILIAQISQLPMISNISIDSGSEYTLLMATNDRQEGRNAVAPTKDRTGVIAGRKKGQQVTINVSVKKMKCVMACGNNPGEEGGFRLPDPNSLELPDLPSRTCLRAARTGC